jgi:ABC-2 type transport system ATP-binding protein
MSIIEFQGLTKEYKDVVAVRNLTASVEAGRITGFLGPNGAGKSTALKCLLSLAAPTSGTALIRGAKYENLVNPLKEVGAVIETGGFNPSLSGLKNLRIIAASAGIPDARALEVLELVDLTDARNKKVKQYSMGMKQRLSLATAILGEPEILVLDEPANGLDPIGIAWLREFLKKLAASGHSILISSHQLAEMQNTVDDVLIIHKGRLITQGSMSSVVGNGSLEEAFIRLVEASA